MGRRWKLRMFVRWGISSGRKDVSRTAEGLNHDHQGELSQGHSACRDDPLVTPEEILKFESWF